MRVNTDGIDFKRVKDPEVSAKATKAKPTFKAKKTKFKFKPRTSK
jgi:hypothetical protein